MHVDDQPIVTVIGDGLVRRAWAQHYGEGVLDDWGLCRVHGLVHDPGSPCSECGGVLFPVRIALASQPTEEAGDPGGVWSGSAGRPVGVVTSVTESDEGLEVSYVLNATGVRGLVRKGYELLQEVNDAGTMTEREQRLWSLLCLIDAEAAVPSSVGEGEARDRWGEFVENLRRDLRENKQIEAEERAAGNLNQPREVAARSRRLTLQHLVPYAESILAAPSVGEVEPGGQATLATRLKARMDDGLTVAQIARDFGLTEQRVWDEIHAGTVDEGERVEVYRFHGSHGWHQISTTEDARQRPDDPTFEIRGATIDPPDSSPVEPQGDGPVEKWCPTCKVFTATNFDVCARCGSAFDSPAPVASEGRGVSSAEYAAINAARIGGRVGPAEPPPLREERDWLADVREVLAVVEQPEGVESWLDSRRPGLWTYRAMIERDGASVLAWAEQAVGRTLAEIRAERTASVSSETEEGCATCAGSMYGAGRMWSLLASRVVPCWGCSAPPAGQPEGQQR